MNALISYLILGTNKNVMQSARPDKSTTANPQTFSLTICLDAKMRAREPKNKAASKIEDKIDARHRYRLSWSDE